MSHFLRTTRPLPPAGEKRRGIALIIVLAGLVLLTILVLAFLTGIGSELQSSKMYANGSSVKLLAQSSVALVMGEIQAATADPTQCWASQPGMIRTYSSTGTATGYYKLYSDANMYEPTAFDATQVANLVPNHLYSGGGTDWYNQPGVYTDLNQPVYVNGTNYYPIVDGNSADYSSTQYTDTLSTLTVPKPATSTIKTLTPMSNSLPAVTGFWLDANTPVNSASPNIAPMPVKWLYVLKNGEVIVPDSNPVNNVVTFSTATNGNGSAQATPSPGDPIVGRIAFWTDDETCKVNINTASDGANVGSYGYNNATANSSGTTGSVNAGTKSSFWDTPRTDTPQDFGFGFSQPVQNEFQRYPGHPATVALSAVFNAFTSDSSFPEYSYSSGTTTSSIAPRYARGGSVEGTVPTFSASAIGSSPLGQLGWRLYSTPDELLYQPTLSGSPGTGTRTLNTSQYSELTPALLQQAKFFITANSEAPDVNLFNLPRVSMWPITLNKSTGVPALTAYDQLLSFCSTLSGSIYYFQRQDPTSQSTDLPNKVDSTGLDRNRELLEYLRTLTAQPIPGFGGNFAAKYNTTPAGSPGDRDQILTEMFDYIRSTNLQDSSTGATPYAPAIDTNLTSTSDPYAGGGIGQVVPIIDQSSSVTITDPVGGATNQPRGFGRFPTVQQAAVVFIGAGDNNTCPEPSQKNAITGTYTNVNAPFSYTPPVAAGKERVQAAFFLQMFDPTEGVPVTHPWYAVEVCNLSNLGWDSQSIFPANATFPYDAPGKNLSPGSNSGAVYLQPLSAGANGPSLTGASAGNGYPGYSYGGVVDFRQQSLERGSVLAGAQSVASSGSFFKLPIYPYVGPPTGASTAYTGGVTTHADMTLGSTFTFSGGTVVVEIFPLSSTGTVTSTTPIQTINLSFPSTTCPVPYSINNNLDTATPNVPTGTYNTAQYTNAPYNNIPPWPTGSAPTPISPGNYLPPNSTTSGSTTTYSIRNFSNVDFLSFLDAYGGSVDTYGVGLSALGRLDFAGSSEPYVTTCDVVRAIVATPGDMRLVAARQNVPATFYQPITTPTAANYSSSSCQYSHMLRMAQGLPVYGSAGGALLPGSLLTPSSGTATYADYQNQYFERGNVDIGDSTYEMQGKSVTNPADNDVPNQTSQILMGGTGSVPGDWDTGIANTRDGAYINRADEGDMGDPGATHAAPYFELNYQGAQIGSTFFSPNRMIPSPGMFGSLPSQVWANKPWQTLLFRPGPAGHVGLGTPAVGPPYTTPPDHLFMDLFNMPVVEPYAISTPMATAGRINMNYQIVPFTYINRDTGLRAVLKNQMVTSIPATPSAQTNYKISGGAGAAAPSATTSPTTRYSINLDSTLSQFLARFYNTSNTQGADGAPDIFRSASEICDIDLVPLDTKTPAPSIPITRTKMDAYWISNALTGDNLRERPYANIYPLLTTKSNTFTVHFRVQTLKQTPTTTNWAQWREGTDVVLAEYRGSQTIERYVDPNATIPDYAGKVATTGALPSSTLALSQYYKFRVVSTKQFPP